MKKRVNIRKALEGDRRAKALTALFEPLEALHHMIVEERRSMPPEVWRLVIVGLCQLYLDSARAIREAERPQAAERNEP